MIAAAATHFAWGSCCALKWLRGPVAYTSKRNWRSISLRDSKVSCCPRPTPAQPRTVRQLLDSHSRRERRPLQALSGGSRELHQSVLRPRFSCEGPPERSEEATRSRVTASTRTRRHRLKRIRAVPSAGNRRLNGIFILFPLRRQTFPAPPPYPQPTAPPPPAPAPDPHPANSNTETPHTKRRKRPPPQTSAPDTYNAPLDHELDAPNRKHAAAPEHEQWPRAAD
jgi:hypothetical protein